MIQTDSYNEPVFVNIFISKESVLYRLILPLKF